MMNTKCDHSKGDMQVEAKSSSSGSCGKFIEVILMDDSITFGQEMFNILVSGEEYDKVFNHLDMLNAPLEGKLNPEEGKLYTTHAITIHAPVPWFLRKIVSQEICHCVESTIVVARTRSMQLATRNISLQIYGVELKDLTEIKAHACNSQCFITTNALKKVVTDIH
ncbi:protein slowmo [Tanacetum coccineum]|uniref:Protein slowmo n=1 Tax=Tanacetum coccineum TaxID=301880 RepID=A0ABQ4YW11_9ASTR